MKAQSGKKIQREKNRGFGDKKSRHSKDPILLSSLGDGCFDGSVGIRDNNSIFHLKFDLHRLADTPSEMKQNLIWTTS